MANPKEGVFLSDLDLNFFQAVAENMESKRNVKLLGFHPTESELFGITSTVSSQGNDEALIGLKSYTITYTICGLDDEAAAKTTSKDIVIKLRKNTSALQQDYADFFGTFSADLGRETKRVSGNVYWKDLTLRDLYCLSETLEVEEWRALLPSIYSLTNNQQQHKYAYVMDNFLSPHNGYSHLNMIETPNVWTRDDVLQVFSVFAKFHALYYANAQQIPAKLRNVIDFPLTAAKFRELKPLIKLHHDLILKEKGPYFESVLSIYENAWNSSDEIFGVLEKAPSSLTHNDCTIRNMCKRSQLRPGQSEICVFDWEIARLAPPQHDIVEFLLFWLPADVTASAWYDYLENYRKLLVKAVHEKGNTLSADDLQYLEMEKFIEVSDMCLLEIVLLRHQLYMTSTLAIDLPFLKRSLDVRNTLLRDMQPRYSFL